MIFYKGQKAVSNHILINKNGLVPQLGRYLSAMTVIYMALGLVINIDHLKSAELTKAGDRLEESKF